MAATVDVQAVDSLPPQHVSSPPEAFPSASEDPIHTIFLDNASATVLLKAGPHTRAVSRAYRALHPPLLSLAPHSTTNANLQAALPTLPSTLTSLDLRGMRPDVITPATLAAIPAALPRLQQLQLPRNINAEAFQAMLRTLEACPHLHTLLAPGSWDYILEPAPWQGWPPACWAPLQDPSTAARVRSLTVTSSMFHPAPGTPCVTLPHLTHLQLMKTGDDIHPGHLLYLAAAAPALRSLDLPSFTIHDAQSLSPLTILTALSDLSLEEDCVDLVVPTGPLLRQLGALTTLRRLSLSHYLHSGWTPAEAGWLSRLTLLTRLDLKFFFCPWQMLGFMSEQERDSAIAAAVSEVATGVTPLLALRRLHLCFAPDDDKRVCDPSWLSSAQPGSFFRRLAAATQLSHLQLEDIPLPAAEACLLTSLQGLTCLQLCPGEACSGCLQWLSGLTGLQELKWESQVSYDPAASLSLCQAAASLPQLHTLSLTLNDASMLRPPHVPVAGLLVAVRDRVTRLQLLGEMEVGWEPGQGHSSGGVEGGEDQDADQDGGQDQDGDADVSEEGQGQPLPPEAEPCQGPSEGAVEEAGQPLAPKPEQPAGSAAEEAEQGQRLLLRCVQEMRRLRVLDLHFLNWDVPVRELVRRLPRSLRQCYLPRAAWGDAGLEELQREYPWVVLRQHNALNEDD